MPRFNGTGPRGIGAGTGWGMGPCGAGYGYGRGYGRGFGRGWGRGMGYGWDLPWNPVSYRQPTASEEKAVVKDDIADLKEELKAAEEHLSQLENQK